MMKGRLRLRASHLPIETAKGRFTPTYDSAIPDEKKAIALSGELLVVLFPITCVSLRSDKSLHDMMTAKLTHPDFRNGRPIRRYLSKCESNSPNGSREPILSMDPSFYKDATVSRGFTYHYFHSSATPGKPTLLFLHGFPSSSYDWRRQVAYFQPKGYGVLVPDIIGAGGTAKPDSADTFRFSLIARDIVDVLDTEGLQTVVGIGHDW